MSVDVLSTLIAELKGSYTREGIVNWFNNPRVALNMRTPLEAIVDGDMELVCQIAPSDMRAT